MNETPENFLAVGMNAAIEAGKVVLTLQESLDFDTLFKEGGSPATGRFRCHSG